MYSQKENGSVGISEETECDYTQEDQDVMAEKAEMKAYFLESKSDKVVAIEGIKKVYGKQSKLWVYR